MKKLNIDLADKGPETPLATAPSNKKFYPSLHFTHYSPIEIPDEGILEIRFKKVSSTERKREGGKPEYDCTIEVHELVSAESDKEESDEEAPTKKYTDAEDALDKLAAEKAKSKKKKSEDEEGY